MGRRFHKVWVTREVLEWPYTVGGGGGTPPPPDAPPHQSDRGKNEIYNRENLIGPFLVHKILGPSPPLPPPPLSNTSLG